MLAERRQRSAGGKAEHAGVPQIIAAGQIALGDFRGFSTKPQHLADMAVGSAAGDVIKPVSGAVGTMPKVTSLP